MVILLPLMLIGIGIFLYLLLGVASYALPLFAGLSVGFAASHAGMSGGAAFLAGLAAFLIVIAAARMLVELVPVRGTRLAVALLFAIPAAIAGASVVSALLRGIGPGWELVAVLATGTAVGGIAARRAIGSERT